VAGKETLNTDTQKLSDIANLTEVVELNKLLFKFLKLVLVVRVVKYNNIIYVECRGAKGRPSTPLSRRYLNRDIEEENNLFVYPKA
jgi:hypothetical protein